MPRFTKSNSVAFSWTPEGYCCGIRLKRTGNKCRITDIWTKTAESHASHPAALEEGFKTLGTKEASAVVAAPTQTGWSMADISLPILPKEQLRNALAFQLRKYTPIPAEKLTWGYRCVKQPTANENGTYRLLYTKTETWKQWCDTLEHAGQIDALIPAPVALDPLFNGQAIQFPRYNTHAETYTPSNVGRSYAEGLTIQQPKILSLLNATDFVLKDDDIPELESDSKYPLTDALILALYALTDASSRDIATLPLLPLSIKTHRNTLVYLTAGILAAVSILAFFLYAIILLQANSSQQQELKRAINSMETAINATNAIIKRDKITKLQELKKEISDTLPQGPSFALALADISNIIDPSRALKPWISSKLTWKSDGNVMKFTLEEPFNDTNNRPYIEQDELLEMLSDSPYIKEVRGNNSNIMRTESKRVRDFTITLGYKPQDEREAGAKRNAERLRQRAKRIAAEEAAAKAAEEAAEKATEAGQPANEQDADKPAPAAQPSVQQMAMPDNVMLPPLPNQSNAK